MTVRNKRPLSDADRRILRILQAEGRIANVDLAERIGMAPSPCLRRVKALEEDGFIEGYGARISRRAAGFGVQAFVQINLHQHTDETVARFSEAVNRLDEVTECHALTGDHDYLLRVVARDLDDLGDTVLKRLTRLPGVKDVRSSIVLNTVKDAPAVPVTLVD
ncbi:Lrp/AsnC family transcriptional regulator [Arenibaculum pallidiluteum]|uniref:Lrp/AsnC family transcriptional regulator n=1 Tax=Arenibaculum pallidiluteum TaxID=2812559 RepID=UPI001A960563|nr:Lrp/AsnC family transcriptional regulator [Arenibaculum pallidiluteum]